jgi:hypothetical protein
MNLKSWPGETVLRFAFMNKIILLISLVCIAVVNAPAQDTAYNSADRLHRDVTFLLLEKNINNVTRQLDRETSSSVAVLLRRLVIYSRAAQPSRVRATLEQLANTPDWQCPAHDMRWLIRHAGENSVDTQRLYYERLCPDDIEGAESFVRLWSNTGDLKELDTWLAERANRYDEWLMLRVGLRAASGTAGEVLDALAAEIRANPSDWRRLDRYLKANNYAGDLQDLSWLADTFEVRTAADYFKLGERVRHKSPAAAARLLLKSLALPSTDADAKYVNDLITRYLPAGPSIKVNEEKQLRYWTKQTLAETYQKMNQPLAAQPLVEELVSVKGDDILLRDVHQLAGAVQRDSGQRVVEMKILGDEAARRSTSEYWLERAMYYDGRREYEAERDSYRQALAALPVKPEDSKALNERLKVVRLFALFLAKKHNDKQDEAELEKLLTSELSSTPPQTDYAFEIARLITQNGLDLDALRDSLLAKRPSFLAKLLESRREWGNTERLFIKAVVNREEVTSDLKAQIWTSLEPLARDPGSTRAFFLAEAMKDSEEWQRAIPLWRGYIDHASLTNWEGYKSDAIRNLFTAYCRTKQWPRAEKFLFAKKDWLWRVLPNALAEVAVAAARQGAIEDAMRLWRMSSNLDRRNLDALEQLAQTEARPQLQAMYSKMKKEDPLSAIPDLALQLLHE